MSAAVTAEKSIAKIWMVFQFAVLCDYLKTS